MRGYVSARRRADDFAAAVESGQLSADVPAETRAFLDIVQQLGELDPPSLRADFSSDLRARLMAEAPSALALADRDEDRKIVPLFPVDPAANRRRRAVSIAASVCIVVGSGVGVAAASQSALPGDALYPLKRGIERLEVSAARSSESRGDHYLEQADTRLSEIEELAMTRSDDPTTPTFIDKALDDFTTAADDGGNDLIDAYQVDDSQTSIPDLRTFTDESAGRLDDMMQTLPTQLHDDLATAAESLTALDATARGACPTCSALIPLTLSSAMVTLIEETEALSSSPLQQPTASPTDPATSTGSSDEPNPTQSQPGTATTEPGATISIPPGAVATPGTSQQATEQPAPTDVQTTQPELPEPSGGVPTGVPSVPLPTDVLPDIPTVPDVIDDVTDSLPDLPLP